MKPFDLQAALAGAKVVTRNGREVKIAGYNDKALGQDQLIGWIEKEMDGWHSDGRWKHSIANHSNDLFMLPTERKEWVVRSHPVGRPDYFFIVGPFETKEDAENVVLKSGSKATIHEITIIE